MEQAMNIEFEIMRIEDYDEIYALWGQTPGVRLIGFDSQAHIEAYLIRNPEQSFVCKAGGRVAGTILCGNDARRAYIYHLAVAGDCRRMGIGGELVRRALAKQKSLGIDKCALFVLNENAAGKRFWEHMGFESLAIAQTMSIDI